MHQWTKINVILSSQKKILYQIRAISNLKEIQKYWKKLNYKNNKR